jgi:hypothetical protein
VAFVEGVTLILQPATSSATTVAIVASVPRAFTFT